MAKYMKQFKAPHERIHSIASEAQQLIGRDDRQGALARIAQVEATELESLVALFDKAGDVLYQAFNEYTIVIQNTDSALSALVVDRPKSIITCCQRRSYELVR